MTYILWAVKVDDEDWQEEIIAEADSLNGLANARAWAKLNGFDRLRVSTWNPGDVPDFTSTVRI